MTLREEIREEICVMCEKPAEELCGDQVCRDCHKSLSFEECVSGEWARELRDKALKEAGYDA